MKNTTITTTRRRTLRKSFITVMATAMIAAPTAVFAAGTFTDVPDSNVFHDSIDWMAENGITVGCNPPANDEYCPSDNVTREQMAAFMKRLATKQVVDAGAIGGKDADTIAASKAGKLGYAWACDKSSAAYDAIADCGYAHNSAGGGIDVTRSSVGTYKVAFKGLGSTAPGGNFQITSYGGGPIMCGVSSWSSVTNASVHVKCHDTTGALADSKFTVQFVY